MSNERINLAKAILNGTACAECGEFARPGRACQACAEKREIIAKALSPSAPLGEDGS